MNVPLSASERQSGWVLGDAAPELRSSSETRYQFPHDLCCSLYGSVMAAAVGSSLAIKLSPKEAFLNSTATRGGETRLAFFPETRLARWKYLCPADSTSACGGHNLYVGFDARSLGALCSLHSRRPTPPASEALGGAGRIGGCDGGGGTSTI